MNYEEDFDLARRLRRISDAPEPAVPGSLYRYLDQVAEGTTMTDEKASQTTSIALVPQSRRSVRSGRPQLKALMGVAAALVVAVTSSDTTEAAAPATVTIQAGETFAEFDVQAA